MNDFRRGGDILSTFEPFAPTSVHPAAKTICICMRSAEIGFPRELRLERQLISSILMSWAPPDHVPQAQIQSYHVYLDGQLKATVRGNDRTKALLEKVDLTHVRGVSVLNN